MKRLRRHAKNWEKNLHKTYLTKDCYLKYVKNTSTSTIKENEQFDLKVDKIHDQTPQQGRYKDNQ